MEISDDIQLGTRITLQVFEGGCDDCFFAKLDYDLRVDCCKRIKCQATRRKDKKNVAFKLLSNQSASMNNTLEEELREDSSALLQANLSMPTRMEH